MPNDCPVLPVRTATPVVMPAGTLKRIHVNQHIIRSNIKTKRDEPAATVQWKGKSYTGSKISIRGGSVVVQRMDKPLSCGARIWIETRAEVEVS
jgi:hypothetical protein